jgi:TetR/AcrR family transcriptional regulator, cholesterol catabolism regulator
MVETRRQQIENVASALFRERGYAATSVRDIAQVLNLQGGSLYAHMASKEDVLWSIVDRAARRFDDAVRPALDGHDGRAATVDAAARLRAMVRAHVAVVTADLGNAAVFLHEWRFLGAERRLAVAAMRDAYEGLFRRAISDGVADGTFATSDVKLAATCLLSALNGIASWYRPEGPLGPEAIADAYADLFIGGLTGPPVPSRRTDP